MFRPVPIICKFATLATPSTRSPKPVAFAAYIVPKETVKLFCTVAEEPVPVTEKEPATVALLATDRPVPGEEMVNVPPVLV